jgi:hypothetical protein
MQAQMLIPKGNVLLARGDYALLARKSRELAIRAGYRVAGLGLRTVYPKGALSSIGCRDELGLILNARDLRGEGVEVGVLLDDHSDLSQRWAGKCLDSVDPLRPSRRRSTPTATTEIRRNRNNSSATCVRLSGFGSRSSVLRLGSLPFCCNWQLDFVYIEAQHHYEAVEQDIELWRPKETGYRWHSGRSRLL